MLFAMAKLRRNQTHSKLFAKFFSNLLRLPFQFATRQDNPLKICRKSNKIKHSFQLDDIAPAGIHNVKIQHLLQKSVVDVWLIRKFVVPLQIINNNVYMNQETVIMEVSEEEAELLAAIRNYNKSFPDGYPQLLWYAQELFDNIIRQPYI